MVQKSNFVSSYFTQTLVSPPSLFWIGKMHGSPNSPLNSVIILWNCMEYLR